MRIEYTENIFEQKWNDIINSSENSYFFHTPAWANILKETYGYKIATRLYEVDDNDILLPMMEGNKYGFGYYYSMPESYGGIFSTYDLSSNILYEILGKIVDNRHILFELALPPFCGLSIKDDSFIKQVKSEWNYTHILFLKNGFDYLWNNRFNKKNRNAIRKAEQNNVDILDGNSLQHFREYYKLYTESSKKWGYKNPPHPLKLYENMYKFGASNIQLRLAVKDDKTIGGVVSFYFNKTVFFWGSTVLQDYQMYRPVNLLLKDSIEYACNEGYENYNLGASGNLEGVRKFKESFGPEMVNLGRYRILSRLGKIAFSIKEMRFFRTH